MRRKERKAVESKRNGEKWEGKMGKRINKSLRSMCAVYRKLIKGRERKEKEDRRGR